MKKPVTVIGMGEMGGVFARGFLKCGHPVYPVTRQTDLAKLPAEWAVSAAVVVAVGEKDLGATLSVVPAQWQDRIVLLQNELLPKDWQAMGLQDPTVVSVWFEKKQPNDYKVIIPSPVFGPNSQLIVDALAALNIPTKICADADELLLELILKNLYIVTTNVCGLKVGGTVGELWADHLDLTKRVADEVLDIQFKLAGKEFDRDRLMEAMHAAFEGDRQHKCMGRSAPARLERALRQAAEFALPVETLKDISLVQK
ncbi:MAG: hypothetical protein K8I00_02985 [Candidatus Omnitrophica bacterium]|nr:hypothetical protein [Candidatus Omnitrophota bacterium]